MKRIFLNPDKRMKCFKCGESISEKNSSLYNWIQDGCTHRICLKCWDFLNRYYTGGEMKSEEQIQREIERDRFTLNDLKLLQEKLIYLENNYLQ